MCKHIDGQKGSVGTLQEVASFWHYVDLTHALQALHNSKTHVSVSTVVGVFARHAAAALSLSSQASNLSKEGLDFTSNGGLLVDELQSAKAQPARSAA